MRRPVLSASILCAAVLLPTSSGAQTAVLLEDIEPGNPALAALDPWRLTPSGGKLFFLDRASNVWVTDGTAAGSQAVAALCAPTCSFALVQNTLVSDGRVLFFASGNPAVRLWRSDGTLPGTFPLGLPALRLLDGDHGVTPVVVEGRLYFVGCADATGCDLWTSDGTSSGTRLVVDLDRTPRRLTVAGRQVFALLDEEVWRSDGTPAGTVRLGDFFDLPAEELIAAGSRVFFWIRDFQGNRQLWASDGTPAGTLPVAASSGSSDSSWIRQIGSRVYFAADDGVHGRELWTSDGTIAGTRRVTDAPAPDAFAALAPQELGETGGRLVVHDAGPGSDELWVVPASATAAAPVRLCPGAGCPRPPFGFGLFAAGDRLLFSAADPVHGIEPWSTDGTPQGTVRLADLCPGSCDSHPRDFVPLGSAAYFVALRSGSTEEVWESDGTPAGTRRIVRWRRQSALPLEVAVVGQRLFFPGFDEAAGSELWTLDSRRGRPRRVADLGRGSRGSFPHRFRALGERVLFSACDSAGARLWASAGDPASTTPLFTIQPFSGCNFHQTPTATPSGALAYFWADLPDSGLELWRTDGTVAGTLQLSPFDAFPLSDLTALPGGVVFVLSQRTTGRTELWASNGTAAGTRKVADLPGFPGPLVALGSEAFFGVQEANDDDGAPRAQVWRTDGTPQGTRAAAAGSFRLLSPPFRLGPAVYFFGSTGALTAVTSLFRLDPSGAVPAVPLFEGPLAHLAHGGVVSFLADVESGGWGLWQSNGTAAGTRLVRELPGRPLPMPLSTVAGRLVFPLEDAEHGEELWVSDGTAAGTGLLRDIVPGPEGSIPRGFTSAGGRLFFEAFDRRHGFELWQTDGTPAGTRLVQDLSPGIPSSLPNELAAVGDRLYFSAHDGEIGFEPWFLPLSGPPCQPSSERLCLAAGRFQVSVEWRDFAGRTGAGRAVPLTGDTGTFWFFDPANLELAVKVLDGTALNGHVWIFYGALSNVEYTLTVTDTQTGAVRRHVNSAGRLASVGDTQAFGPLGASVQAPLSVAPAAASSLAELPLVAERVDPAAAVLCEPGPRRLCLNGRRFAVTATWKDFQDRTGEGTALPLTGDTGAFWFFDPANVEVLLKVVDGRGLNGRFWVFYGALSNVEYQLTVTDTETGTVKTYSNPRGRFASAADTAAF